MEVETYYDKNSNTYIYGFCAYCKNSIKEGEEFIEKDGKLYHHSEKNPLESCYFGETK